MCDGTDLDAAAAYEKVASRPDLFAQMKSEGIAASAFPGFVVSRVGETYEERSQDLGVDYYDFCG